jgi:hypothetical protein
MDGGEQQEQGIHGGYGPLTLSKVSSSSPQPLHIQTLEYLGKKRSSHKTQDSKLRKIQKSCPNLGMHIKVSKLKRLIPCRANA